MLGTALIIYFALGRRFGDINELIGVLAFSQSESDFNIGKRINNNT
jgi:hypothetical protein